MLLRWVDAFTDRPFAGNQAVVCLAKEPHRERWMQSLASEVGVAGTAFVGPLGEGFSLRWFSPERELDLCGHATLAAAHVLWEDDWLDPARPARFTTRSGQLSARRVGEEIELDLRARTAAPAQAPPAVLDALGVRGAALRCAHEHEATLLLVLSGEEEVRTLAPSFDALRRAADLVVVTSRAETPGVDFVSRVFAPGAGIDEDSVTGSAHCLLGPYWASRLGRAELVGLQVSPRGGRVRVKVGGNRVAMCGTAVTLWRGSLQPATLGVELAAGVR
jgi:PhzF family phenazine biosynthesis protein